MTDKTNTLHYAFYIFRMARFTDRHRRMHVGHPAHNREMVYEGHHPPYDKLGFLSHSRDDFADCVQRTSRRFIHRTW